jgi:Putative transposase
MSTGQAKHHRPSACTSLAPSVCKVALSPHRLVSLTDRPGTFTSRPVGSARLRTAQLDVMEFLRRFLQHVLPHGFVKIRHFGFLHASCAIPLATIRLMIMLGHPMGGPADIAKAPATTCGPLSDLWRTDARRHACVDLTPGLC